MPLDHILLARLQFAFTISFHIIFPAFTIGLASYLAVLEGAWLTTKNPAFRNLYLFWVKVFALAFGMGVVSGVVMSYEFGTNWSVFADKVGSVIGPLLGFEVLTAFFLEASFLGIMLFGWRKVGPGLHFAATCIVATGTLVSAFWILSANSWMQTPQGFAVENGRLVATDWLKVIFTPSFPTRFAHMVTAAYLTTAMVVIGTAAFQALRGRANAETRIMQRMGIGLVALLAPLQVVIGHASGIVADHYQPAKIAATEGWWDTGRQSTILLGWPDDATETTSVWLETPKGFGSWIVSGDANAVLPGLKTWPKAERPPTLIPFWSFRLMVGLAVVMIGVGWWGAWSWVRGRLEQSRWFQSLAVLSGPAGFLAVLSGWMVTEVGRQPYLVYGVLTTADAASPVGATAISGSLLLFIVVYAIVFTAGAVYIGRLLIQGPSAVEGPPETPEAPGNPLAIASDRAAGARTQAAE